MIFRTKNLTTNENEVILVIAGGDKLTFFSEVGKENIFK